MALCSCLSFLADKIACMHKRSPKVPEQYLRPQGLYTNDKVDLKRLRRLILDGRLAPCYAGCNEDDAQHADVEECPICFLFYPALNTSKCCGKRVCTECFLQVQTTAAPHSAPTCPFCKQAGYTAKFQGPKTEEQKHAEKLEEQRVVEARIREREEEKRRDQDRELQRLQQATQPVETAAAEGTHDQGTHRSISHTELELNITSVITPAREVVTASPLPALAVQEPIEAGRTSPPATVPPLRNSRLGGRQRFKLSDYVPNGASEIPLTVDDLNELMFEQALYESMAEAARQSDGRVRLEGGSSSRSSQTTPSRLATSTGQNRAAATGTPARTSTSGTSTATQYTASTTMPNQISAFGYLSSPSTLASSNTPPVLLEISTPSGRAANGHNTTAETAAPATETGSTREKLGTSCTPAASSASGAVTGFAASSSQNSLGPMLTASGQGQTDGDHKRRSGSSVTGHQRRSQPGSRSPRMSIAVPEQELESPPFQSARSTLSHVAVSPSTTLFSGPESTAAQSGCTVAFTPARHEGDTTHVEDTRSPDSVWLEQPVAASLQIGPTEMVQGSSSHLQHTEELRSASEAAQTSSTKPGGVINIPLASFLAQAAYHAAPELEPKVKYVGMVLTHAASYDRRTQDSPATSSQVTSTVATSLTPGSGPHTAIVENPDGSYQIMTDKAVTADNSPVTKTINADRQHRLGLDVESDTPYDKEDRLSELEAAAESAAYIDYDLEPMNEIPYELEDSIQGGGSDSAARHLHSLDQQLKANIELADEQLMKEFEATRLARLQAETRLPPRKPQGQGSVSQSG